MQTQKTVSNVDIRHYNETRAAGDIDLIGHVRQLLVEAGLSQQVVAGYDNNPNIMEGMNKRPDIQRYLLNRFWLFQLMNANDISIEERYCLVPNGSIEEWIRLFKEKIIPFAIKNRLPVQI